MFGIPRYKFHSDFECSDFEWFNKHTTRYIWYSKFYPNKVIQIDRLKLSTEISHVKKLSSRVIQELFYPTLTLLFLPDFITVVQPYLPYLDYNSDPSGFWVFGIQMFTVLCKFCQFGCSL